MSLAHQIENILAQHTDKTRALRMKSYMKDHFEFYGISSPLRKEILIEHYRMSYTLNIDDLLVETDVLWNSEFRECQYVAGDLLIRNKKKLAAGHLPQIEKYIVSKSWWDTVDFLASHLVGIIFKKYEQLILPTTDKWIYSDDIWLNRTCLLYQLKYGTKTDFEALKKYISRLIYKEEFFIQKAIGWSLRQYSKYNPQAVRDYIEPINLSQVARREAEKYI